MGGYISRSDRQDERYVINPTFKPSSNLVPHTPVSTPPYFWNEDQGIARTQPELHGYSEGKVLIGGGSLKDLDKLVTEALQYLTRVYEELREPKPEAGTHVVSLHLSEELLRWRAEQYEVGNILPSKGKGLKRTSPEVIRLLGAEQWPDPLLTNNALFGSGWANLLIGAYDVPTLYSNYCLDMGFYYEHGYAKVFPQFEAVVKKASNDMRALRTPAGTERRKVAQIWIEIHQGKDRS